MYEQPKVWLESKELVPFMQKVADQIQKKPTAWLDQSFKSECQLKYMNVRIDQRTGEFVVTGDVQPSAEVKVHDAPHFFPRGWTPDCGVNSEMLKAILRMNENTGVESTLETVQKQAKEMVDFIKEATNIRHIEFNDSKALTVEQVKELWK